MLCEVCYSRIEGHGSRVRFPREAVAVIRLKSFAYATGFAREGAKGSVLYISKTIAFERTRAVSRNTCLYSSRKTLRVAGAVCID